MWMFLFLPNPPNQYLLSQMEADRFVSPYMVYSVNVSKEFLFFSQSKLKI
jgi:hypothetical protein